MTTHLVVSGTHYGEIAELALSLLSGLDKLDELSVQLPNLTDDTPAAGRGERLYSHLIRAQTPLRAQGKRLHRSLLYSETYGAAADGTYALPLEQGVPRNEIGSAALEIRILTNPYPVRGFRPGQHPAPLARAITRDLDRGLGRIELPGSQRIALARWRGLYMTQLTTVHALADQLCKSEGVQALWSEVREFHRKMTGSRQ